MPKAKRPLSGIPRFRTMYPFLAVFLVAISLLALFGCILDSQYPAPASSNIQTQALDLVVSSSAKADSSVSLYQPLLDNTLGTGERGPVETYPPVNVKDHESGKIIGYQVNRQRFGSWNGDLEFKWNYFLLRANFLFIADLPDTTGLADATQSMYTLVHKQDPFTRYFDSAAAPGIESQISTSTKAGALGVMLKLNTTGDTTLIKGVVAGSPAEKGGLKTGMGLLSVNDSAVTGDSAVERFLRFSAGDSGKVLRLTVYGSQGVSTVRVILAPVAFPTVLTDSLLGVGYIAVTGFTPSTLPNQSTLTEFRSALLETKKFPVTILDFRDNPGGSLDMALGMCDEILPSGSVIIRELQRHYDDNTRAPIVNQVTTLATSVGAGEKTAAGTPRKYLLLGNGHSASAAEIFLVSVREGAKAPLMGTLTYGKGIGQTVRATPGKGLALVTFLKFTSASGLDYHKHGLVPDIVDSTDSDQQLADAVAKALEMVAKPSAKHSAKTATGGTDAIAAARNESEIFSPANRSRARLADWNRRQALRNAATPELFP